MRDQGRKGLAAGATIAVMALPAGLAIGAVGGEEPQIVAEAPAAAKVRYATADVELRFVQEDGPESGHVRVELTPAERPLSFFEARSAAQQAFLETLKEPGLGGDLQRITVVVYLAPPAAGSDDAQTFLFLRTGAKNWSVMGAD